MVQTLNKKAANKALQLTLQYAVSLRQRRITGQLSLSVIRLKIN